MIHQPQLDLTTDYSPWDLLPVLEPKLENPPEDFFYSKVVRHLSADVIKIMANGIPIDLDVVRKVEADIDVILEQVDAELQRNPLIRAFQAETHHRHRLNYIAQQRAKLKTEKDFLKTFDPKSPVHRAFFVEVIANEVDLPFRPTDDILPGIPKWSSKHVNELADLHPALMLYKTKKLQPTNKFCTIAMKNFAKYKLDLYNKPIYESIQHPEAHIEFPKFNLASPIQKRAFFESIGLKSESQSKDTGEDSWKREEIERVNKETTDPELKALTKVMIDYSFGAIVKSNFIQAFYNRSVFHDDCTRLHGTLNLFGAKTFRLTSQAPNLLNMPSTKSIYAKPIKKCLIAPPGFVVLTADFNALEDRVMASLSKDTNKCNIFLQNLDGHCLNAYGYYLDEIAALMPITGDTVTDVKKFYELTETNSALKAIRQNGKPATFGLSYGAFPKKVAATLKISLAAATAIFDNYHHKLYPGVTDYRENYVLPTAKKNGRIHLGLGCYLRSDMPDADIRTLTNATCQFWSILTLLTINKMHKLIERDGLSNDVFCISTIYDSIYFIVRKDANIIKWVNDYLIRLMTQDFLIDQIIPNTAESEIGLNWASLHKITNNASIEEIEQVLTEL